MIRWILRSRQLALILTSVTTLLFSSGIELVEQNYLGLLASFLICSVTLLAVRSQMIAAIAVFASAIAVSFLSSQPILQTLLLSFCALVLAAISTDGSRRVLLGSLACSALVLMFQVGYSRNLLAPLLAQGQTAETIRTQSLFAVGLTCLTLFTLSYLMGRIAFLKIEHIGTPRDRASNLLNESRLRLEITKQNERLETAKDLSELLVQKINAIVSVSEGGRYSVRTDPTAAERIFDRTYNASREAQKELRRLYDYLNSAIFSDVTLFKISDLNELAISMREFGYNTVISEHGDAFALNDGMELCVYKIVYESVTNVRKHAPIGTEISIDFLWVEDGLQVLVKDNGVEVENRARSAVGDLVEGYSVQEDLDSLTTEFDGATIAALRDRAQIYGGRIEATKVPGVGFTVSAIFPNLKNQIRSAE